MFFVTLVHGAPPVSVTQTRPSLVPAQIRPFLIFDGAMAIERYQRVYGAAVLYAVDEFVKGHEAIIAALRAADAEAAERTVIEDWHRAAERFAEMAAMLGDRGSW